MLKQKPDIKLKTGFSCLFWLCLCGFAYQEDKSSDPVIFFLFRFQNSWTPDRSVAEALTTPQAGHELNSSE